MGRRIIFLVGMALFLAQGPALAWAQSGGGNAPPATEANAPPSLPAAKELAEPQGGVVPPPSAGGLPPVDDTAIGDPAPPARGTTRPPRDPKVMQAQAPAESPAIPPGGAQVTPPTQPAAAPASGEPAPPGGIAPIERPSFVLSPDQLTLGKQEVAVSVDVHSPANMNLNQLSTVKITVKNTGSADARGVVVRDELPPGLELISSQPEAQKVNDSLYSWRINTLPAGGDRVILMKVKPTKTGGMDHAATVSFLAGSKASSRVLEPKLKLEVVQNPSVAKVLKGQSAEFRIAVTNTGDGPARNVNILAKLSPGLRYVSGERNEDNSYELPLDEIGPGQREELDPLTVDAIQGGEHWCKLTVNSPDVVFVKEEAEITRKLEVVEPKLTLVLAGPEKRFTDTVSPYTITVENPGTAPAKNVRVVATLPVSGRLVAVPPDARYDAASRRIQWTIPQIEPGEKPRALNFEVRMGGIGYYEVTAEGKGDNALTAKDRRTTDVQGMPDIDLVVRERRRVVDVDGTTTFQIRIRNYGTKEAGKVQVRAELTPNLQVVETGGGPEQQAWTSPEHDKVKFPLIERLGPGKEMVLGIKVKVTKASPRLATCRVFVLHDDLTQELEDMAAVKVQEGRHTAAQANP